MTGRKAVKAMLLSANSHVTKRGHHVTVLNEAGFLPRHNLFALTAPRKDTLACEST